MATLGERILIIESDLDISDLIARQSLQPLGYQVTVVSNASVAITQTVQLSPDLIIVNLNLPGLSGKDLLVALASQGVHAPLMVIAEKGQESDAIQAFRLGATDVLFWPARDAEVVSAVERALRQTYETRTRQKLDQQLKKTNEELQHRVRDLTSLLTIGKAVVSITDQRQLFDHILEGALQLAEADIAWLLLRDEKTKLFLLSAHRNLPEAWAKKMKQPLDDGISSLVALSGESLLMNGAPLQKFKVAALGKSAGVIPIKAGNEVIGLLIVIRKADQEIGKSAQIMLEAVADYSSISLVNAQLFNALAQTADAARLGEESRKAALDSARGVIREEVQNAIYPLETVLSELAGAINVEQRKALVTVHNALKRLTLASESTIVPEASQQK
jgi:DNA-binding response OmpR family regulator